MLFVMASLKPGTTTLAGVTDLAKCGKNSSTSFIQHELCDKFSWSMRNVKSIYILVVLEREEYALEGIYCF